MGVKAVLMIAYSNQQIHSQWINFALFNNKGQSGCCCFPQNILVFSPNESQNDFNLSTLTDG